MPFSLNRIQLIGNLGQDAETRTTNSNKSVTSFSIATVNSYKGQDGYVNETTWHNIVAWEVSDFLLKGLKKGAKFYVEGRVQNRSYEDKEGNKKYITEVITNNMGLIPLSDQESSSQSSNQTSNQSTSNSDDDNDLPF